MNYINVFQTESSFNDVSNNLSLPQLSYIIDNDEVFCLSNAPAPSVEMVDLGLSVKWAKYNLGATGGSTVESWHGTFFSWGEIEEKTDYSWNTYKFGTISALTKYNDTDGKTVLDDEDDAALVNQKLRIPTEAEANELLNRDKITVQYTSDYNGTGVAGYTFTSKVEGYVGNTLFIPMAGFYNGAAHIGINQVGIIWVNSLYTEKTMANALTLYPSIDMVGSSGRYGGACVRGVQSK